MKDAYGIAGSIAEQAISSIRTTYSYLALKKSMKLGIKQVWAFQAWVGSVLVIQGSETGGIVFIAGVCIMVEECELLYFILLTDIILLLFDSMICNDNYGTRVQKNKISESFAGIRVVTNSITPKKKRKDSSKCERNKSNLEIYPSRPDTPILQGFNLKVQAGKTLGGSGSGKSTIISLLERFYDPEKGDILLDKYKIKRLQLKWLRSHMGLVNQEPVLFATSIKENILFGKEDAPMELVIQAAKAANAHDFIIKLPQDMKLSQSALDAESERLVQEALDQASQGRTTIIIAHRLSTIRKADLIVVFHQEKWLNPVS
ncbi:abc transporter b family member 18 [Quercus suber]|uniref:Abc transporter b family member 18 n=1 Tax=Quercus suber TaxID=58331 RepID=A0AAW0IN99_QUESU